MKQKGTEIVKTCKKLMCLGSNLLVSPPFKKIAPAISTPKFTQKTQKNLVTTQRKRKKTIYQRRVQFETVLIKKKKGTIQVSSYRRFIRRRWKS